MPGSPFRYVLKTLLSYSIRGMPKRRHSLRISSGQMLAWISPICALWSNIMQSLLWPIPPPILKGSSPLSSFLWKKSSLRSSSPSDFNCLNKASRSTRMPIELSSNDRSSTGYQIRISPLRPVLPFSSTVLQSS